MFGLNRLRLNSQGGSLGFAVQRALFNNGEQGLWYDLNDDSTIFQDSAGTTLATWGDPVGLVLDKHEGDGRGVVNLIADSGDVSAAYWSAASLAITRPSADTIVETTGASQHFLASPTSPTSSIGQVLTKTVTLKKGSLASAPDIMQLTLPSGGFGTGQWANVNVNTGAVESVTGATCTALGADPDVAGGWRFRYTATATAVASGSQFIVLFCNNNPLAGRAPSYTGSVTSDCKIYKCQTELGSTATAYQANGASVGGPGNHAIQSTSGARMIRGRMPKAGIRNELVNTDTLSTQNVTVTNVQRVLSFWGTGTITLSGTSTAGPLVGVDANTRVSLTFTPTAGTLTLTVTGTVSQAQLEVSP